MNKKILSLVLVFAMILTAFTGCKPKENNQSEETASKVEETNSTQEAQEKASAEVQNEQQTQQVQQ